MIYMFYTPWWCSGKKKNPPANTGDTGDADLISGSRRSPGEGNGNPFHYSCLENPLDRGAWWATVHGVTKSWTRLSTQAHTHTHTHTYIYAHTNIYVCLAQVKFPVSFLDQLINFLLARGYRIGDEESRVSVLYVYS